MDPNSYKLTFLDPKYTGQVRNLFGWITLQLLTNSSLNKLNCVLMFYPLTFSKHIYYQKSYKIMITSLSWKQIYIIFFIYVHSSNIGLFSPYHCPLVDTVVLWQQVVYEVMLTVYTTCIIQSCMCIHLLWLCVRWCWLCTQYVLFRSVCVFICCDCVWGDADCIPSMYYSQANTAGTTQGPDITLWECASDGKTLATMFCVSIISHSSNASNILSQPENNKVFSALHSFMNIRCAVFLNFS